MPEFMIIGSTYYLGRGATSFAYKGPIVASRDAFYLVVDRSPEKDIGLALGGVTGALIAGSRPATTGSGYETDLADLPPSLTRHPEWPVKRSTGRVVVLTREWVESIEYDPWGTYDLISTHQVYRLELPTFHGQVLAFLAEQGWDEKRDDSRAVDAQDLSAGIDLDDRLLAGRRSGLRPRGTVHAG
jgi:hypothetical protein